MIMKLLFLIFIVNLATNMPSSRKHSGLQHGRQNRTKQTNKHLKKQRVKTISPRLCHPARQAEVGRRLELVEGRGEVSKETVVRKPLFFDSLLWLCFSKTLQASFGEAKEMNDFTTNK